MLVNPVGNVKLVKLEQSRKAEFPILIRQSGNVIFVKELQWENAELPMLVRLLGNVTSIKALWEKAEFLRLVTGMPFNSSGMNNLPSAGFAFVTVAVPLATEYHQVIPSTVTSSAEAGLTHMARKQARQMDFHVWRGALSVEGRGGREGGQSAWFGERGGGEGG